MLAKQARKLQEGKVWGSINDTDSCPGSCCEDGDLDCRKRLDNTGYPLVANDELILIFGGMSARNQTFYDNTTGRNLSIFDDCETYAADALKSNFEIPDLLKNCGEELQNDIWVYSLKRREWQMVKLDYNPEIQTSIQVPTARMYHTGVYAELDDPATVINNNTQTTQVLLTRKYLYIYGGFSRDCTNACFDTWRYEIPYGPYTFYPRSASLQFKYGNYWEL